MRQINHKFKKNKLYLIVLNSTLPIYQQTRNTRFPFMKNIYNKRTTWMLISTLKFSPPITLYWRINSSFETSTLKFTG